MKCMMPIEELRAIFRVKPRDTMRAMRSVLPIKKLRAERVEANGNRERHL